MTTTIRTVLKGTKCLISSSDTLEQSFVDDCDALGLEVYAHPKTFGGYTIATQLLKHDDAIAALDILRSEGYSLLLTNGLFFPDELALILCCE